MTSTQVALSEVQGPLNQLNTNLSGANGREWLSELNKFLRKEVTWTIPAKWRKQLWTVAPVGIKKSVAVLVAEILERDFDIRYSETTPLNLIALTEQIEFNDSTEEAHFVLASPRDLGLKPGRWSKRQLLDAAPRYGLEPCLSGDILEILAQGKFDLGDGRKALDVAMEPVVINTHAAMFCVAKYDRYHLGYHNGDLHQVYTYPDNVDRQHIFRIKKTY